MRRIRKVNIRSFSREMYHHLKDLPIVVYNKYTKKALFVVISVEKGSDIFDLSAESLIQSKK